MLMYFFADFLGISPFVWRVLVTCLSFFTDNSNRSHKVKRSRNFIRFMCGECQVHVAGLQLHVTLLLSSTLHSCCVLVLWAPWSFHLCQPSPHVPSSTQPSTKKNTNKILKFFQDPNPYHISNKVERLQVITLKSLVLLFDQIFWTLQIIAKRGWQNEENIHTQKINK
jgi:hypothetical protein